MAALNWNVWLAAIHDHRSFGVVKMMLFCRPAVFHSRKLVRFDVVNNALMFLFIVYFFFLSLLLLSFSGNILTINEVRSADRGLYYCIADNGVGTDRRSANFDVEFPPQTSVPRPKVAQAVGYDIELECRVEGYPAPSVTWFRNEQELYNSGGYSWVKMHNEIDQCRHEFEHNPQFLFSGLPIRQRSIKSHHLCCASARLTTINMATTYARRTINWARHKADSMCLVGRKIGHSEFIIQAKGSMTRFEPARKHTLAAYADELNIFFLPTFAKIYFYF